MTILVSTVMIREGTEEEGEEGDDDVDDDDDDDDDKEEGGTEERKKLVEKEERREINRNLHTVLLCTLANDTDSNDNKSFCGGSSLF